jgi:hypothetical protein
MRSGRTLVASGSPGGTASANRRKAIRRVAKVQQRVANARKDFLHKHSTVVVEALKVRNMSASAKGNCRSARSQGKAEGWPESLNPRSGVGPVPYLDGMFFVNIRYVFSGDRLAFVKAYHRKGHRPAVNPDQAALPFIEAETSTA